MKYLLKSAVAAAIVAMPLAASQAKAAGYCASGAPLKFAGVEWESGQLITKTIATILHEGYGCQTEEVGGTSLILTTALAMNDIQIFAEQWVGRTEIYDQSVAKGTAINVGHPFTGAAEGWFVPTYMIKGDDKRGIKPITPDLKRVEQLGDPKIVSLFTDPEEPAKGRFLNCPPGWSCESVNTAKLAGYKLDDKYTNFHPGSGAGLDASITGSYLRGEPILFYYWSPTAMMGKLDLTRLEEPAYNEACWKQLTTSKNIPNQACAYPTPQVVYGVNTQFAKTAPDVLEVLNKASFPIDALNKSLAYMTDNKVDAEAASQEFLKTRQDIWGSWVSEDAKAKILSSLK